jgi:hypothetical protein
VPRWTNAFRTRHTNNIEDGEDGGAKAWQHAQASRTQEVHVRLLGHIGAELPPKHRREEPDAAGEE